MRALPFPSRFGLVVNLFTSFGYFATDRENRQALREMVRVLAPGGELLIDHIHRAHLESHLVPADTRRLEGLTVHQRRRITRDRVQKEIEIHWDDGRRQSLREDVRLFAPEELGRWAAEAGLEQVRLFGSFRGDPLGTDAQRMILVARKPAPG
jgi:SAM-dependent methyltransferase